MSKYVADFETTTQPDDCRVWAWGLCEIGNVDNYRDGKTIDQILDVLAWEDENPTVYFHNLRFDGTFLMCWLFAHGYRHVEDRKDLENKTFTTLISDMGQFYSLDLVFKRRGHHTQKVTFIDSYKILPFAVSKIAKDFGLPMHKLEIEYEKPRPVGYEMDTEERAYLRNDCVIVAKAMETMLNNGLERITIGSNALHAYEDMITLDRFKQLFPEPSYDKDIRMAYKGGFTYLDKRWTMKDMGAGIVLDVNSLYPSVMRNKPLPYGNGIHFEGKYKQDKLYPLYVQQVMCHFDLKKDHIPTIQIKDNKYLFSPTEYLESNDGEDPVLTLTSVDLELFYQQYDVYNEVWLGGWKFKSQTGLFIEYIDHWSSIKIQAKKDGNGAMYTVAKLMLNSFYGKFGTAIECQSKIPYYDDGIVKYKLSEKELRKPIYIPVAAFITAWARWITITAAQSVYDRFIYADTDSLHLIGTELPTNLDIDDTKLGAWKHEGTFRRARYIRQKAYVEDMEISQKEYAKLIEEKVPNVYTEAGIHYHFATTCSGMPDSCHKDVSWSNFKPGTVFKGKLRHTSVRGGIFLKEIPFTLKAG